ncbi:MAG: hypothetical protein HON53_07850 [Planctomycetaceae bacterium]|nr:hypothetical protein [Planctomycetaceae bacterium]MBT6156992.1 hypothetical protein [Planctomycetaceae bacterium]MBT6484206.1 hypothetical protein [Planctomycetaceae bacterium]MBT6495009.1 hypothetical protein [Planctomycetaceae bacterium]
MAVTLEKSVVQLTAGGYGWGVSHLTPKGDPAMRFSCLSLVVATAFSMPLMAADDTARTRKQEKKSNEFELTIRKDNGAYETAAFSFRFASQSLRVHRNLVDLVYNRCGNLHVNAHGGMKSRIADLGVVNFDKVDTAPKKGWRIDCARPHEGHVFVQEINDGRQKAYIKFVVTTVQRNGTLKVKWSPLKGNERRPEFRRGSAGTMGQCGGLHRER